MDRLIGDEIAHHVLVAHARRVVRALRGRRQCQRVEHQFVELVATDALDHLLNRLVGTIRPETLEVGILNVKLLVFGRASGGRCNERA